MPHSPFSVGGQKSNFHKHQSTKRPDHNDLPPQHLHCFSTSSPTAHKNLPAFCFSRGEFHLSPLLKERKKRKWSHSVMSDCDPVDCSLPGSSIQGILQARIMEWVAISSSRGSSQPKDRTQVSRIAGRSFTLWATREPLFYWNSLELSCPCQSNSGSILLWESLVFSP